MTERKAAVQMSLGFIVAIVIAVVMLSLVLGWMRGMFGGVTTLTEDLTQQAQSSLRDAFRETGSNFAVWPSQYEIDKGKGIRMSAGIENDDPNSLDHYYKITVIPAAVSDNVLSARGCTSFEACPTLQTSMSRWVTFDTLTTPIKINTVGFKYIDITVPNDAVTGTYMFNVIACYDGVTVGTPTAASVPICDENTPSANVWGNPTPVVIVVK
ncbi:MAG: hypothetical protein ACE5FW_01965 [Candidatus Aenigmatarchaeota archaeon]